MTGPYRLDAFGLADAVRLAAELRAAPGPQAVARHLLDAFDELVCVRLPGAEVGDRRAGGDELAFGAGDCRVVAHAAVPVDPAVAERFTVVAAGVRAGLLGDEAAYATELEHAAGQLSAETELVGLLEAVGRRLTAQLDLDALVQDATGTATKATGAAFGAFFYNVVNERGESYTLYTIAGVPREAFESFPMPRNTAVFAPTFAGEAVVRSDDIMADPRYGHSAPHYGMPAGHLPVRSYLAVPVVSATTRDVLGGFFFGHPEAGRFTARHQQLAEGIAGYAAIALDNAHLYTRQRNAAAELQRSMLPAIPEIPGFAVVSRYLPAATGSEVGGDWLDVIELPAGRTAFVIGDVMGRGIPAATVMGQIRTAVRSYARLDLPPAEVLRHVSELAGTMPGNQFITCVYAVHDPADATITYANAGHLPPVLVKPDARVTVLEERLGLPLRVGADFDERQVPFPPGCCFVLYTDGLVERRGQALDVGLGHLRDAVGQVCGQPDGDLDAACDKLIDELTGGRYDDDVALLLLRDRAADRRALVMPLSSSPDTAARARRTVRDALHQWGLAGVAQKAMAIATELVANAVRHTGRPGRLRLHQAGDRLIVEVSDGDQRPPRRFAPTLTEENHRGMLIVDGFARRWGTRPLPDGKAVWAEIALG